MYSKLFTAGLQVSTNSSRRSTLKSWPSSPSASLDFSSPITTVDPANPIYFTIKPKSHKQRSSSNVDDASFLSLDTSSGNHKASSRSLPKPKPHPSANLPSPPSPDLSPAPLSALPTITSQSPQRTHKRLTRSPSALTSATRPSVRERRNNRSDALAALEGRTKRSFWDETDDDDDDSVSLTQNRHNSSTSSLNSSLPVTPFTPNPPQHSNQQPPLNHLNLNIPTVPLVGSTSHSKRQRRERSSTIESWYVPNFMDLVVESEDPSIKRETVDSDETGWTRVVGVNLALVI